MSNKRTQQAIRPCKGAKGTPAPSDIIVHRLTAEPDNKQTFCPVQPREFVEFSSNDLTLENLKIACAEHFGYLVGSCDVLVSNKGPSCTNMNQIPHRKDKVSSSSHLLSELLNFTYLTFFHWVFCQVQYVRFVANLEQDEDERYQSLPMSAGTEQHHKPVKCAKFISEPVSPTKAAKVPRSYIQLQYQLSNC